MNDLLSTINWTAIADDARKELRNREIYAPTVSAYRWWARRSHRLIGALVDQAMGTLGHEISISDPFSGGGTVAVEAARRGLRVFAQDINPWATLGLRVLLEPVDVEALQEAGDILISRLRPISQQLYGHPIDPDTEIVCQLHVRRIECPSCRMYNFLYPTSLLALNRRPQSNPTHAWYGCPACGSSVYGSSQAAPKECDFCGYLFSRDLEGRRIVQNVVTCVHCNENIELSPELLRSGRFIPSLRQIYNNGRTSFEPALGLDSRTSVYPNEVAEMADPLKVAIPQGIETGALLRMGFQTWKELYPDRQLQAVHSALNLLPSITDDPIVIQRLRLAIAGFGEMAGYAARWDPRYRKVYEIVANHHYSRVHLAAEVNPLGNKCRGTLQQRIRMAVAAARWFSGSKRACVTTNSSERQPIPTESIDLVVTDPPYFDSVQYGELSQVFHVFGRFCGLPIPSDVDLSNEVVPNRKRGFTVEAYQRTLTRVFCETARTLKPNGRMVLTFHDKRLQAWAALADALKTAEMRVVGLAITHSENETDHTKRNRNSMTSDLIIECTRLRNGQCGVPLTLQKVQNSLEGNLAAMGAAIRAYVNSDCNMSLDEWYHQFLKSFQLQAIIR